MFRTISNCRVCKGKVVPYAEYPPLPLANDLLMAQQEAIEATKYPVTMAFCPECGVSQLLEVIDCMTLFGDNYTYRSSISAGYRNHIRSLTSQITLPPNALVIDIAGNDGTLLQVFKEEFPGIRVLNVDPATNLIKISIQNGIPGHRGFWPECIPNIKEEVASADLFTATNVLAHVEDPVIFLKAWKDNAKTGVKLIVEVPHHKNIIDKLEFDTIYLEHQMYFTINSMINLAKQAGVSLYSIEHSSIHGGSLVCTFINDNNGKIYDSVLEQAEEECQAGFMDIDKYIRWWEDVESFIENTRNYILDLKASGQSIAAFGASAKGNTLLNSLRLDYHTIDYIVDDTPEKVLKYSPGTGIPVVSRSSLRAECPDHLMILAWNFTDEIIQSLAMNNDYTGKFIVPIQGVVNKESI